MTSAPHPRVDKAFVDEASAIDSTRDAALAALRGANARGLSGADVDAVCTAFDDVTARCEALRRRYFPHRYRLAVTKGTAITMSKTGRSIQLVWKRERPTPDDETT